MWCSSAETAAMESSVHLVTALTAGTLEKVTENKRKRRGRRNGARRKSLKAEETPN